MFLSQFFETAITAFVFTPAVSLAEVSGCVFGNYGGGRCVCFIRKKLFKLSIKLLARIRFPTSSKCKPSQKRLDVGMLLLSMKTSELSRHMLEMRWFTLQFIINNNSRD